MSLHTLQNAEKDTSVQKSNDLSMYTGIQKSNDLSVDTDDRSEMTC